MGSKIFLQRRPVKLVQASLVPEDEDDRSRQALLAWNNTFDGPIAASSLELQVGEQRLVHTIAM